MFEIVGFGPEPKSVADGAAALTKATDLDKVKSGWGFSGDAGGTLWVKVEKGEHSVVVSK